MWKFVITSGALIDPTGKQIALGYAGGNLGKNPEGINNPLVVSVHNIGPLPPGFYTFGHLYDPHPKLGRYAFELIPDAQNVMFGRSGFFCHGDTAISRHASEGCIIMPHDIRVLMFTSGDHRLQVVAV
jgi:hypothetical protein